MHAIEFLDDPSGYRPGACNIGPAEIARRQRAGIAGMASAAVLAGLLVAADAPTVLRLLVGVPLFFGILGLAQARLRFCVGFALGGLRNFGALGSQVRVDDRGARRADLRRAIGITAAVAAASGALALAFALLPL